MLSQLITVIVLAYIVAKIIKSGTHLKVLQFLGLVKQSVSAQGARATVYSVIDGLFDGASTAKQVADSKLGRVAAVAREKKAGLKPQDWSFNAEEGELTIRVSKGEDLIMGRNADGTVYAYSMDASGHETELNKRAFQRRVKHLQAKGKLSDAQEKALKDFMLETRRSRK